MLPGARFPVAATIYNAVQQGVGLAEELEEEECLPPLPDFPLLLQSSDDEEWMLWYELFTHCLIVVIILL